MNNQQNNRPPPGINNCAKKIKQIELINHLNFKHD
jgi:hypothetical protein